MESDDSASFLRHNTNCSFGRRASLLAAAPLSTASEIGTAAQRIATDLTAFVAAAASDPHDGFLVEVVDAEAGKTLMATSVTTRSLLSAISELDPAGEHCMRRQIDDPAWSFAFAGEVFYPLVLSPCYPPNSSRYSHGSQSTFVVLLLARAFQRHHEPGTAQISNARRRRIRLAFDRSGQSYDVAISLGQYECYRIVKPLQLGDPVVRWWETEGHEPPSPEGGHR